MDLGGSENSGSQKLPFYCTVHVTPWDLSIRGIAMGECCGRGSSIDVRKGGALVYLLSVGEAFRNWQVLLPEVTGIQIRIQFVFFRIGSRLPGTFRLAGQGWVVVGAS